jgi:molecular chaperone DnaK
VDVSAKNMATGKQQSIRITASSGLTKEEIDRLVQDAEFHAESDRKKKGLVDARNTADALIYTTEKSLSEFSEKINDGIRSEIEDGIKNLKRAMEGEHTDEIKRLTEVLKQTSHKMASDMYHQTPSYENPQSSYYSGKRKESHSSRSDDEVVDAEYHEVA